VALRLSGQLLLGCARIYSRQTKYLLEDCGDALIKLKVTFKPGAVDLREDQAIATFQAITMADTTMTEFDILLPEPALDLTALMLRAGHAPGNAAHTMLQEGAYQHTMLGAGSNPFTVAVERGVDALDPLDVMDAMIVDAEDRLMLGGDELADQSIELELGRDAVAELPFTPTRRRASSQAPSSATRTGSQRKKAAAALLEDFSFANEREDPLDMAPMDGLDGGTLDFGGMDLDMPALELGGGDALGAMVDADDEQAVVPKGNLSAKARAAARTRTAKAPGEDAAGRRALTKRRRLLDEELAISDVVYRNLPKNTDDIVLTSMRLVAPTAWLHQLQGLAKRGASAFLDLANNPSGTSRLEPLVVMRASVDSRRALASARGLLVDGYEDMPVPDIAPAAEPNMHQQDEPAAFDISIAADVDASFLPGMGDDSMLPLDGDDQFPALDGLENLLPAEDHSFARQGDFEAPLDGDASFTAPPADDVLQNVAESRTGEEEEGEPEDGEEVDAAANPTGIHKSTVRVATALREQFQGGQTSLSFSDWTRKVSHCIDVFVANALIPYPCALTGNSQKSKTQTVMCFFEVLVMASKGALKVSQPHASGDTTHAEIHLAPTVSVILLGVLY
jgi:hypothetical protein